MVGIQVDIDPNTQQFHTLQLYSGFPCAHHSPAVLGKKHSSGLATNMYLRSVATQMERGCEHILYYLAFHHWSDFEGQSGCMNHHTPVRVGMESGLFVQV